MQLEWTFKINFPEADFWLTNRSSRKEVGKPTREYRDCLIGVKCPDYVLPGYGFYLCEYLHMLGTWAALVNGTTDFVRLNICEVRSFFRKNYTVNCIVFVVKIDENDEENEVEVLMEAVAAND